MNKKDEEIERLKIELSRLHTENSLINFSRAVDRWVKDKKHPYPFVFGTEEEKGLKSSVFVEREEEIYRLKAEIMTLKTAVNELTRGKYIEILKKAADCVSGLKEMKNPACVKEEERVIQPKEKRIPNFEGLRRGYIVERKTEANISILSANGRINGPPHIFESKDECKEAIVSSKGTDVHRAGYIFYKIIECYK